MGCDIHWVTEVKTSKGWKVIDGLAFDDRNYDVFAVLAGVRNKTTIDLGMGSGKSIADSMKTWQERYEATPENYKPMAEGRGIPLDFSIPLDDYFSEVRDVDQDAEHGHWLGDHSHTWFDLSDWYYFDWQQMTHQVTLAPKFWTFDGRHKVITDPTARWGYTWVDHKQGQDGCASAFEAMCRYEGRYARDWFQGGSGGFSGGFYTAAGVSDTENWQQVDWHEPYWSAVSDNLLNVIHEMTRISVVIEAGLTGVRAVFGFDS